MPRFSDSEKEFIQQKLKSEGEKLFTAVGLKKVTIEDLVKAAGIAKASFYLFYPGKEHLFFDITQTIQKSIYADIEELLEKNSRLHASERIRQVFEKLYLNMNKYPILSQIDVATMEYLYRKLPKEVLEEYNRYQLDAASSLSRHGVKFNCEIEIASKAFQAVYYCWMSLKNENRDIQKAVIDIVLNGVINQVVKEEA